MIRRLYVHNFRCLENFGLSLDGAHSVLLLGRNGTGKTTVGSALELLQRIARGINRVGDIVQPRDLARGRDGVPMRFEIEADLNGEIYLYSIAFEFPPGFRELRVLDEKLEVAGRPVFTRDLAEVRIARANSKTEVTFGVDWHVIALPIVQEQSIRTPLSVFRTWLSNTLILRPIPSLFRGISDGDGTQPAMIDAQSVGIGAWFTDMIATSPATYSQVSGYLRQVMPDFSEITNQVVGKNTRSLQVHFAKGLEQLELDLDQLSDGEKCFVLYSLVIAASTARSPLLCFWDEPDNFLAPDEVGQSIMGLRRAFRDTGQLIVTSHNPETIRRFSDDNTFYLARRNRLEPTTYSTVKTMRERGEYAGSLVNALLRGDIASGAEGCVSITSDHIC